MNARSPEEEKLYSECLHLNYIAWQFPIDELFDIMKYRIIKVRDTSFYDWLISHHIDVEYATSKDEVVPTLTYAFEQNRSSNQLGKAYNKLFEVKTFNEERASYRDEYEQEVPERYTVRPLDLTKECDVAYVRVVRNRSVRMAALNGENV